MQGFTIPDTPLLDHFLEGTFSGRELIFLHSACRFAYYFHHESNENFEVLKDALSQQSPQLLRNLNSLAGHSLGTESFTLPELYSAVSAHPESCKVCLLHIHRITRDNYSVVGNMGEFLSTIHWGVRRV